MGRPLRDQRKLEALYVNRAAVFAFSFLSADYDSGLFSRQKKSLVARDFRTVGIVSSYDVPVSEVHFAVCRRAGKQLVRPL